jgi:hypothetical protein
MAKILTTIHGVELWNDDSVFSFSPVIMAVFPSFVR